MLFISCNEKGQQASSTITNSKKNFKSYIDFKYDDVLAFATVNPMEQPNITDSINLKKFNDIISIKLNDLQINKLNDILSGKENSNDDDISRSDCFYPRHNIVFLNKNTIVNYILICFECNDVKSSKPTSASMKNYKDFFNSLGLTVFYNPFEHAAYYDSIKPLHKNRFR